MSIRKITTITPEQTALSHDLTHNQKVLLSPVSHVSRDDIQTETVQQVITDLHDTLFAHEICIGLAAPQIGYDIAIVCICETRAEADFKILINPKIISETGKKDDKRESCMSLPGYAGSTIRRKSVEVEYMNEKGQMKTKLFDGFSARMVLHEIDHMSGLLYRDRLKGGLIEADLFDTSNFWDVQKKSN